MKKQLKIVLLLIVSIVLIVIVYFVGSLAYHFYWPFNRNPSTGIIYSGYYKCEPDKVLKGGNFGKGPLITLQEKEVYFHIHAWEKIQTLEFQELAMKWYGKDISNHYLFKPVKNNEFKITPVPNGSDDLNKSKH